MEQHKLDTPALALSAAASFGLLYIVMAILAATAPSVAGWFANIFASAGGNVTELAATGLTVGNFFTGLIVSLIAGLVLGALISSMYNGFVAAGVGEASSVRRAHASR